MKARISAMICLLCVLGSADLTRAEDPYSQRVADPYALSPDPPSMSSGTLEPYMSFFAGVGIPFSHDATFTDGTSPRVVEDIDYKSKFSLGGNLGVWFPTRDKLGGFDLGLELTGFLWYPDVHCCRENYNGITKPTHFEGTSTEISSLYIGPNFLLRYPLAISETYPNGRWFPYVGVGVGMHQMSMRPGGARGVSTYFGTDNSRTNPITEQRNTTVAFQGVGGIKGHLFKYVAAFIEAKYIYAHHDGLLTDRFGASPPQVFIGAEGGPNFLIVNPYSSTITTILVHAGLSIHFDWKP